MNNLVPVAGYATISPEKEKEDSAIIIRKEKDDAYIKGKVIKVGGSYYQDGIEFKAPCKPGDVVLYSYSGFEDTMVGGKTVRIIRFSAIVGIFKESN